MKSAEQIIAYIDHYYSASIPRPQFHFIDAVNMESVLTCLEGLREYILDDAVEEKGWPEGYLDFIEEQGYGSHGIRGNKSVQDGDDERVIVLDRKSKMEELAKLWTEYLARKRGFKLEKLPE